MEQKISLRPLEPEDLELLYTIENDMTQWHTTNTTTPYSHYDLKDYILNQQHDIYTDRQIRLVITLHTTQGTQAIGLADIYNYDPHNDKAEIGIVIKQQYQGNKYATQALTQLVTYARDVIHLHQLYAIVQNDNKISLNMLNAAGFNIKTTLQQWLRQGKKYQDAILMQIIL